MCSWLKNNWWMLIIFLGILSMPFIVSDLILKFASDCGIFRTGCIILSAIGSLVLIFITISKYTDLSILIQKIVMCCKESIDYFYAKYGVLLFYFVIIIYPICRLSFNAEISNEELSIYSIAITALFGFALFSYNKHHNIGVMFFEIKSVNDKYYLAISNTGDSSITNAKLTIYDDPIIDSRKYEASYNNISLRQNESKYIQIVNPHVKLGIIYIKGEYLTKGVVIAFNKKVFIESDDILSSIDDKSN